MLTRIRWYPVLALSPIVGLLALLLGACSPIPARLNAEFLASNASAPPLQVTGGQVITDNDQAFARKLALINNARQHIDLAYYLHGDDYSSSVLNQALLEAARRGVRVRMLLDYHGNYSHLDLYQMLEQASEGRLQVRLFNRPTANIIRDAAYLSLGCGEINAGALQGCDTAKYAAIDARFAASSDPANVNIGGSGLVLAGLYGKDPGLLATAILEGQNLDLASAQSNTPDPQQRAKLQQFLELYWQARFGGLSERLLARLQLDMAFSLYGAELQPVRDSLEAYLPVAAKQADADTVQDWNHFSDFLHHKLLLVDDRELILGGRNVEDAYHMAPNPLTGKYVFNDVDIYLRLANAGAPLAGSFQRLWDFHSIVASLDEVQRHAPIEPLLLRREEQRRCADQPSDSAARHRCLETVAAEIADQDVRLTRVHQQMQDNAATYRQRYRPAPTDPQRPSFNVDPSARVYYLENLPIRPDSNPPQRQYGARAGHEQADAKHIHAVWRAALRNVCRQPGPQRVILHNAYLFLPAGIRAELAAMLDGSRDCANTEIVILTNSPATTDLNVINVAAGYSLRALGEYLQAHPGRQAARLRIHEYRPLAGSDGNATVSLHAKVMLFGEDIFIGSANADVRSFMMDTNNGVYLQNAPDLVSAYRSWIDAQLTDPGQTREVTVELLNTPVAERLGQDMSFLATQLARRGFAQRLDSAQRQQLEAQVQALLVDIHQLAAEALRAGRRAEQRFDQRFKGL